MGLPQLSMRVFPDSQPCGSTTVVDEGVSRLNNLVGHNLVGLPQLSMRVFPDSQPRGSTTVVDEGVSRLTTLWV